MLIRVVYSIEARKMNVLGYLASVPTQTISGMILFVLLLIVYLASYGIARYKSFKDYQKLNSKTVTYPLAYVDAKNVFILHLVFNQRGSRVEAVKI